MQRKNRYNIVKYINPQLFEVIILTKGGNYSRTKLSKPALETNFEICEIKFINGEDLNIYFKIEGYSLETYSSDGKKISTIYGWLFTENDKEFTDYNEASLFFELYN